jgi:hypothetical protein
LLPKVTCLSGVTRERSLYLPTATVSTTQSSPSYSNVIPQYREYSQHLFQPWICEVQPYMALNLCRSEPYCHCSLKQDLIIFYSLSSSSNSSFTPSMVSECSSYFRNSTRIPGSSWLHIVAFGGCRLIT